MNLAASAASGALAISTAANAAMVLGALYNVRTAPRLENHVGAGKRGPYPKVSLLIPARDEEANLSILVPLLDRLDWPDLEILILDDESRDGTARIAGGGRARVLAGRPLPSGWLGKNWACHQLAREATGEILLFCDADVRPAPDAIAATVGCLRAYGADAATALPRQIMETWSERAVLPVLLMMPLLGCLPLAQVPRVRWAAASVGCGQWFAFSRAAYDALGGHAAVRSEVVEDLALGRRVKKAGFVLVAALSPRLVSTRMYAGFPSLWRGFTKNLVVLTGTGFVRPPAMLAAYALAYLAPWALPFCGRPAWLAPLALWLIVRGIAARAGREPPWAWLWSPVGALLIPCIAARSWRLHRARAAHWKGRVLTAAFGSVSAPAAGSMGPGAGREGGGTGGRSEGPA
jgi:chlorobactene glucosyltransferase